MPTRDKIRDETIFCGSQASVHAPDLALAMLLFSSYEWRTISVEV